MGRRAQQWSESSSWNASSSHSRGAQSQELEWTAVTVTWGSWNGEWWRWQDPDRWRLEIGPWEEERKGAESLMQYADRRETQFASAAALGHQLPDTYMAQMMIERANLTAQNEQNLRTMTGLRPSMAALKVLDTQSGEQLTKSSGTNRSFVETVELHGEPPPPERFPGEPEDTDDEEIVQTLLAELEPGVAGPFRG